ncbi:MAG: energy transducer TonB [Acidobacteriota bacterium]|nr:energy transducer TonB [Acidobacteriota bacterium]
MTASEVFLREGFEESGFKHWAKWIGIALLFHVVIFLTQFPKFDFSLREVKKDRTVMTVRRYVPPPPKQQPKKKIEKKITKKVPIPDPTPDEPEPIIEPEPPPEPEPLPDDVEILLGDPEPPPVSGPLIPGIGGVSEPELVSRIEPEYPELARRARIQGKVILRAIIKKDGTVRDIEVLKEPAANLGFSASAVSAVKQWRYRPATQNGRPVDVYFTVVVTYTLD